MNDQIKNVHSIEEILTSVLLDIRRLIARSKTVATPEESGPMRSIARSAYDYLIIMLKLHKSSYRALRHFEAETYPEPLKTAHELLSEVYDELQIPTEKI